MGNYLLVPPGHNSDKKLLKFFKAIQLPKILECFDYFHTKYHPNNSLTYDKFDDIFSPVLNCSQ